MGKGVGDYRFELGRGPYFIALAGNLQLGDNAVHNGASFTRVWTLGCGASEGKVSIWRPDIAAPYVFFGDSVVRGGSAPHHCHVTMRDDEVDTVPPVGFRRIVDQQRGGAVYIWEPVPPSPDYVALGDVATLSAKEPDPAKDFPRLRCVARRLTQATPLSAYDTCKIWADSGTGGEDFAFFSAPTGSLFVTMGPGRPGGGGRRHSAPAGPFSHLIGSVAAQPGHSSPPSHAFPDARSFAGNFCTCFPCFPFVPFSCEKIISHDSNSYQAKGWTIMFLPIHIFLVPIPLCWDLHLARKHGNTFEVTTPGCAHGNTHDWTSADGFRSGRFCCPTGRCSLGAARRGCGGINVAACAGGLLQVLLCPLLCMARCDGGCDGGCGGGCGGGC